MVASSGLPFQPAPLPVLFVMAMSGVLTDFSPWPSTALGLHWGQNVRNARNASGRLVRPLKQNTNDTYPIKWFGGSSTGVYGGSPQPEILDGTQI
eukprot:13052983-Heterocapsa_arctica.AAC.1